MRCTLCGGRLGKEFTFMTLDDWAANDEKMFEIMQTRLYTGAVSDVLDEIGLREQAMSEEIRPLEPSYVLVGRAKTILATDVYEMPADPYKLEIESIDSVKPNDVVVACTNNSSRTGFWGELLSSAAKARGARGAVMDGFVRDVKRICALKFPVFARGIRPVDSRGRSLVIDYDCTVMVGGVIVRPGDVIMADCDGVVVIPQDVAVEVVAAALDRVEREQRSKEMLLRGAYLRDVYEMYKVL